MYTILEEGKHTQINSLSQNLHINFCDAIYMQVEILTWATFHKVTYLQYCMK